VKNYRADDLEQLVTRLGIAWQGCGKEQVRLGYPEDLALLHRGNATANVAELFADPAARYGFLQLADRQSEGLSGFNELWWQDVWRGLLSADSLAPLRQGESGHYRLAATDQKTSLTDWPGSSRASSGTDARGRTRRGRRGLSGRAPRYPGARAGLGWSGNWVLTSAPLRDDDPIADLEDAKDRVRLLLERYGFICRELANREGDGFGWQALFRALRTMELSGEVLAGLFFHELSGPQFVLPAALPQLQRSEDAPETFWVNAMDPVAPCGLGLAWKALPQRRSGNYLSFHRGKLALLVENRGRRLTFLVEPDHPKLPAILAPLSHLLRLHRRLPVESINGLPALQSGYLAALAAIAKTVNDHRHLSLESR
jgi:ATP-dependent Lhr-like helicase